MESMQKSNVAPTLSYNSVYKPLKAPKGKRWDFDPVNKEWSLVTDEPKKAAVAVNARIVVGDETILEHHKAPTDTFQGLCVKYNVTPSELRRANGTLTGDSLSLGVNPLKIQVPTATVVEGAKGLSQTEVVGVLLRECPKMSRSEARAYLMLNDWDLNLAIENAREDGF